MEEGKLVRLVDVWPDGDDSWILTCLTEDGDLGVAVEVRDGTPYEVRPEDSAPDSLQGNWEQRVVAARTEQQAAFVRRAMLSTAFLLLLGGGLTVAGVASDSLVPLMIGAVVVLLGVLRGYFAFRIARSVPRGPVDAG